LIFVTVGTQLPFDRLINAVDAWASENPDANVVAQIGPTTLQPKHMQFSSFLAPDKADEYFAQSTLVVSHAGMGSVLTALKYKKPILIMPRKANLSEHRNEHQMATAKWLCHKPGVTVAWDETEVAKILDARNSLAGGEGISDYANPELIANLRSYLGTF
jgi:UDP-N-acetylglucosamine transferase subunit ALG13